jgi:hypothetical protein
LSWQAKAATSDTRQKWMKWRVAEKDRPLARTKVSEWDKE